ncbi:MAG TPA: biotin/lipoyl-binding protein [Clostridia bacterium]|nr:biotin/lipoyl-binding protein [Clostridia bacterium]
MKYKVTLNGKTYEVEVEKTQAMLLDEYQAVVPVVSAPDLAPQAVTTSVSSAPTVLGGKTVNSPLPGSIINIKVSTGQIVTKGTVLMIIEAMKMENEITAPHDGKIGQILVGKGAQVSTGTPLLELL